MFANLIGKLRDWMTNKFGVLFENFRDPETGKLTFARPETAKKMTIYFFLTLFFLVLVAQVITTDSKPTGGKEAFTKEVEVKNGISTRDSKSGLEDDPFKTLGSLSRDEFGLNNNSLDINERNFGVLENSNQLSVAECTELYEKLKKGQVLSDNEKTVMNQCLSENKMALTEEEKKIAEKLTNEDLTPAQKEFFKKALNDQLSDDEKKVLESVLSDDPKKQREAEVAIEQGQKSIDALGKNLSGKPLSDEEKKILSQIEKEAQNPIVKAFESVKETIPGIENSGKDLPEDIAESIKPIVLPNEQDKAIKQLAEDVSKREKLIENLEDKLAKEQIKASPIAEKLATGKQLSAGESNVLRDFTKKREDLDTTKKLQELRKTEFAKRAAKIQEALTESVNTVQRTLPSGTFIEYEGTPVNCTTVNQVKVKKKPKIIAKQEQKEQVLDLNGRPLRPEEVEFIKLHRKNQYEVSKLKKDAINGPNELSNLGNPVSLASVAGEGGTVGIQDLNTLFFYKDGSLKSFELTPDMKIPAVTDSEILTSDKSKGTMVRYRVLADVPNPRTNKIEIPKGAIIVGRTGSFDKDTGVMDLTADKAVLGGGKTVAVNLAIASGDGSMGLKGQVYDTTGKYLTGAFISAFTAGAISFATQQYVAPNQSSTVAGTALAGSALAGAAEVATKISELMVSKLQNAASIFYVPKGIPVVLIPQ